MPPPTNLIVNGTFDAGDVGWSGNDIETNHSEGAYLGNGSSNRVAEMDGLSGQTTVMEQTFTVDNPQATQLTLDVALRTASLGQAGSEGFTVEILDSLGNVIASDTVLPTTNSFVQFTLPVNFTAAGDYTLRMTEVGPDNSLGAIIDNVELLVCFGGGTRIELYQGRKKARKIRIGDLVRTQSGIKPVRWVGRRVVTHEMMERNPKLYPIRIEAGALGNGLPKVDLLVSRQHRMYVNSPIAERMFGRSDVLLPAIRLTDLPGIEVQSRIRQIDYVHLLFDQHEIVFAEGAPSESLYTGPEAWRALPASAREEIRLLFPELTQNQPPSAAAAIPERVQQRELVRRMVKNGQRPLDAALAG